MNHRILLSLRSREFFFSLAVLLLCTSQQIFGATTKDNMDPGNGKDLVPSGKGWGEQPDAKSQELANFPGKGAPAGKGPRGTTNNGISYHGGPLITSPTTIYYIWYGNWSGNSATTILANFASNIGGSPYFNINTTYKNGSNVAVPNNPFALNSTSVTNYLGNSLSDTNIQQIISDAISTGKIGSANPNAVYFVLTSSDVNESSGFCTKYCGWHTHGTISGMDIKYSFVGNPDRCPSACEWQTTNSPNNNTGADGMASIIAHELEEAVTDPDLNAWYDTQGRENADKCAWTFGTTYNAGNGSLANMALPSGSTNNYLIQQNWVNAGGGYCSKSY
jgi:hypothetical protein